jgi:hypothetical protein
MAIEKELLDHFVRHGHLLLPPSMLAEDTDLIHWWTVMQHYRAPTRLLDWTRSPFVALYFACVGEHTEDGAVWAFNEEKLAHLEPRMQDLLAKDQASFFWTTRVSAHLAVVDSKRPSERMNAQQGVFTVANAIVPHHEQFIDHLNFADHANDLVKIEIAANCKLEMLERLREMNVHGSSLFPGIDGVGAMMRDLALIRARRP